jgi:hypothetical protein
MFCLVGCNSSLKITFVPGLGSEPISTDNYMKLIRPSDEVDRAVSSIDDVFLVKNYKDDTENNVKLYNYGKQKWEKHALTYKKYNILFIKESKSVNLRTINSIHSFNDVAIIDSLTKAQIANFHFTKDSIIVEKFKEGKIIARFKY